MPRIVIATGIAGYPIAAAGNSWAFLQWVLGFRAAGWEVMAVESLTSASLVGPDWTPAAPGSSANETHWYATMQRFGLAEHAVLLIDGNSPRLAAARAFARSADLMLNISGHFRSDALEFPQATKIYLDLDPAFTQIWAETYTVDMNFEGHDVFFSVGSRLGRPDCRAPDCGRTWHPTLPPVVLDYWPDAGPAPFTRLTTIAHWHGYSWCEWQGQWYTGKSEEFNRLRTLPKLTSAPLEIATDTHAHAVELEPFRQAGWSLAHAPTVCATYESYESYIRHSSGEISAAKGGYVLSQCGWVSDRTVCYLASGRPAVVQRTTAEPDLPTGSGLLDFSTLEEAAAACEAVHRDHAHHCRAARRLAEAHCDSHRVIARMLQRL